MDISNVFLSRNVSVNNLQPAFHTGKDNFIAQVQQARMAPQQQDTVSLSNKSYEERLSELRKMHENTDYSDMSAKDIYRLIRQRFQDAFPNYWAIIGGFYNCTGENSIYVKTWKEEARQLEEACGAKKLERPDEHAEKRKFNRYIYGYDEDISDEELLTKIKEKYSAGTLADQCGMAFEMMYIGLLDIHAGDAILMHIQDELVKGTEEQYGYLHRDNPLRVNAMIGYGENNAISWTQLISNLYEERKNWKYESEAVKNQMLNELEEQLNRFLDRLELPRVNLN